MVQLYFASLASALRTHYTRNWLPRFNLILYLFEDQLRILAERCPDDCGVLSHRRVSYDTIEIQLKRGERLNLLRLTEFAVLSKRFRYQFPLQLILS